MKIVHISNSAFDGAGIAGKRIFNSLLQEEKITNGFFISKDAKKCNHPNFKELSVRHGTGPINYFRKKIYWRRYALKSFDFKPEYDYFTIPVLEDKTPYEALGFKPDLIHLHWINNIIDFPSFFKSLPKGIPVVWTLHDMSPMTGGCLYSWDCTKFQQTCYSCPQLNNTDGEDLSTDSQKIKKDAYEGLNLQLVANSNWLFKESQISSLFKNFPTSLIHYPIDHDAFAPIEKDLAKEALGIDKEDVIICFGAIYLNSKRKGLSNLLKALEILQSKHAKIKCLIFGKNLQVDRNLQIPAIISMGNLESVKLQRLVYSAADIFVIPSLQESFGQTCLEAMACGTPVVGFASGGITDMIIPDETGYLAEAGNEIDLAEKISYLIDNSAKRAQLGIKARKFVVENFDERKIASKYIELYQKMLNNNL